MSSSPDSWADRRSRSAASLFLGGGDALIRFPARGLLALQGRHELRQALAQVRQLGGGRRFRGEILDGYPPFAPVIEADHGRISVAFQHLQLGALREQGEDGAVRGAFLVQPDFDSGGDVGGFSEGAGADEKQQSQHRRAGAK